MRARRRPSNLRLLRRRNEGMIVGLGHGSHMLGQNRKRRHSVLSAPRVKVTVAVRTSLRSCRKAGKTRIFAPVRGSFWESRLMSNASNPLLIGDLVRRNAQIAPSAPALVSVDGGVIPWQQLLAQVEQTRATLSAFGLGAGDCVALLLPNGPVLAQTFLSVAACATCAPLNLAYSPDELAFYLRHLGARAIIISEAAPKSTIEVAVRAGITILKLQSGSPPYGMFDLLISESSPDECNAGPVTPDSIALLLHTSGTTASPKLVPLCHDSLLTSAHDTAAWLQLSPGDCCLNIMPLFHIHGLIGGLLSALVGGGSSVCPPDFQPEQFFPLAEGYPGHLVHRCPNHAPCYCQSSVCAPRTHQAPSASIRSLLLSAVAPISAR
jgi:acyl-CoA synthetase (AMP-forming)/AMP-acid ligase II